MLLSLFVCALKRERERSKSNKTNQRNVNLIKLYAKKGENKWSTEEEKEEKKTNPKHNIYVKYST